MSTKKDFGRIYEQLFAQCPQYTHGPPWDAIAVPDSVRQSPLDPSAVLAALRVGFPDAELLASGVATMSTDGDLHLDPALCDAQTAIVALREKPKRAPFNLATERGCVAQGELPVCECLRDTSVQGMLAGSSAALCVAFSSADVALLLSLGVPATLATGLAHLSGRNLDTVCRCYRLGKYAPQTRGIIAGDGNGSSLHAVVLGWSLAALSEEEPPGLAELRVHFGNIERHLDLCLERFCLWRPTPTEFEKLAFRLKHTDVRDIGSAIKECLRTCRTKLVPAWTLEDVPEDLAAALRRLDVASSPANPHRESREDAWHHLQETLDRQCTQPWLQAMEDTDDAAERNLLLLGATTSGLAQMQAVRLLVKLKNRLTRKGVENPGLLPKEEFRQYIDNANLMLKTLKELWRFREDAD